MTPPLGVDLGQSFESFRHGAEEFFHRLADIGWPAMAVALALYAAHLLARSRAWQNVLRAAYPERKVPYPQIAAAYLAGAGLNSFIPARVGDARIPPGAPCWGFWREARSTWECWPSGFRSRSTACRST